MASSLSLFVGSAAVSSIVAAGVVGLVTAPQDSAAETAYFVSSTPTATSTPPLALTKGPPSLGDGVVQLTHAPLPVPQLGCNCPLCCRAS